MKVFHCAHCGQLLFFENVTCMRCGRALAFLPEEGQLVTIGPDSPHRLCDNYAKYNICNWAVHAGDDNALCRSCRLTRTIPNLAKPGNDRLWYKLEVAKRRLLYTFDRLGLAYDGMVFEFMENVTTGHKQGVITVNLAEADDAERTKQRLALNEPYRTLLGHMRHESGHYFWDRLIGSSPSIGAFRVRFGDERADYQSALNRNYGEGAPMNWQANYVSAYAAMHPWEDWAETWAHYLHMIDTLETAAACGISIEPPRHDEPTLKEVPNPVEGDVHFDTMMRSWSPITYVLNNLNRGLGNDDAYPFVLSDATIDKLHFIHDTIAARSTRAS